MTGLEQNPGYEGDILTLRTTMPDWVKLTPKGLVQVEYNPEKRVFTEVLVVDPITCLAQKCEIDDEFTVQDLCDIVSSHAELKSFIERYSNVRGMDEHLAEAASKNPDPKILRAEVSWAVQVTEDSGESVFDIGPSFSGVGEDNEIFGLSGRPLGTFVHLPIKLNVDMVVDEHGGYQIVVAKKEFTLLEVLHAFFWEIGFHGSPSERDRFFKESTSEISGLFDDGSCPFEG